jgi:hypothetical protein
MRTLFGYGEALNSKPVPLRGSHHLERLETLDENATARRNELNALLVLATLIYGAPGTGAVQGTLGQALPMPDTSFPCVV